MSIGKSDGDDILRALQEYSAKPRKATYKELLVSTLKRTYPFPPNPVCSSSVSVTLVTEALEEAGYKNFKLYVHPFGIFIEPK